MQEKAKIHPTYHGTVVPPNSGFPVREVIVLVAQDKERFLVKVFETQPAADNELKQVLQNYLSVACDGSPAKFDAKQTGRLVRRSRSTPTNPYSDHMFWMATAAVHA